MYSICVLRVLRLAWLAVRDQAKWLELKGRNGFIGFLGCAMVAFSRHWHMELAGLEGFTTTGGLHDVSIVDRTKNQSIR